MLSATWPVTIRQIEIELDVTYKTAFQIWKRRKRRAAQLQRP